MKNTKIGNFMLDKVGALHGKVSGLGIGSVSVLSESMTSGDNKPYLKLIADPLGEAYEIGVAFPKEKDGMQYYSVVLDSPVFTGPISAALFPDKENPIKYNLVWDRLRPWEIEARSQNRRFIGADATP